MSTTPATVSRSRIVEIFSMVDPSRIDDLIRCDDFPKPIHIAGSDEPLWSREEVEGCLASATSAKSQPIEAKPNGTVVEAASAGVECDLRVAVPNHASIRGILAGATGNPVAGQGGDRR